jgi:hypothetical protein
MYAGSNHNLAKIDNEFPVMINDQLIPRVHSIPCLGVNWDEHIEMVCKKSRSGHRNFKAYIMQALCSCKHIDIIYNALIQPYFDYCSPLWGSVTKH